MSDTFQPEHDAKIAVLEVEVLHLKGDSQNTRQWLSSIDKKVDDIKGRLDKQNGAIPHMQEDIKDLADAMRAFSLKLEEVRDSSQESKFKTGMMWAGLSTVVATAVGLLMNFFYGAGG